MSSAKKSCNVCIHAGKSEEIYTSHNTKNGRGKVVCPTLLSNTCHSCKQKGHTVKYCPETKDRPRPPEPDTPPPPDLTVTPISTMVIHRKTSDNHSYASIVNMPPQQPTVFKPVVATVDAFNAYIKQNKRKHRWASESSSEPEEDTAQEDAEKTRALKKVLHLVVV